MCNPRFSWREIAQEMAWPSCRVQKLVYFRNLISSLLSIRICDRSAQFLVNCSGKIVMATNNSVFYSTYLLVSEERRQRETRERHRAGINRRASEEDSSGKIYAASETFESFVSPCDVFNCLFALDLQNEIQLLSTFFCYSWLACLLGCG